jgi:adenine deaminase
MRRRTPHYEMTAELAAVAMGKRPADIVISDGRLVNVCSAEIIEPTDIAILGSRIAYCGPDASAMRGVNTQVIEAAGRYLVPGLLDAHMHVESSMLTIGQFARAVLPHGTTGAFIDPHEIANVLGLDGIKLMVEEAQTTPMQIYVQIPSCVPAAPGLENAGASIGPEEVAEAMRWPGVIGLGEVMNYIGVANGNEKLHAEIKEALIAGGIIGGHYASPDLGSVWHAYAAAGPSDCHEGTRVEDAIARVRQGMYAMLRQGSAWHDLVAQLPALTENGLDSRHFLLCTDDRHPGTLLRDGHMDELVRIAIEHGIPPITAIQMATLNTAEHFGVSTDIGCIAPGRYADILIVPDLERFSVDMVFAGGEPVAEAGKPLIDAPSHPYPKEATESVRLGAPLQAGDFFIPTEREGESISARVIEVIENQATTRAAIADLPVENGIVLPDPTQDIALLAVVDRHHASGRIGRGFVRGFSLKGRCALASTVAHDSHNLLIMGTDPAAMAIAGNHIAKLGGGVCLVERDKPRATIPLPIAGLMSNKSVEQVAGQADSLHRALAACGCTLNNAFMTFSLLALPVIPELRLSDLGVVDVAAASLVPLFPDSL